MAMRVETNPLEAAYAAILSHGLDGAGEALRILVDEASKIERSYLNTSFPNLSALVLTKTGGDEVNDGYITAGEWPAFNLKSDLMVLSACETGLGKVKNDIPHARALTETKREMQRGEEGAQYADPYYWAPFVLYGLQE